MACSYSLARFTERMRLPSAQFGANFGAPPSSNILPRRRRGQANLPCDLSEVLDELIVFSAPLQLRHDMQLVRRFLQPSDVLVHRPVAQLLRKDLLSLLGKIEIGHQRGGVGMGRF